MQLGQQFRDALGCVRHRTADKRAYRYATVELIMETVRVRPSADHGIERIRLLWVL